MSRPILDDAFAHHVWATLRLIDTCAALSDEQLASAVPGTYGSILDTMRHTVGADSGYLFVLTGGRIARLDEEAMSLAELRPFMVAYGDAWSELVKGDLDADEVLVRNRDDGSSTAAPVGIRLAQALHHGTDHRSQICTALTALGIEPPDIDVWSYADAVGRLVETPPTM
jgi:uncharacterized damage-inducible protein DinB